MRRIAVPAIPFVLSMGLSLSSAGGHLYWQDSGFFLVAVRELGVLYPPGFALYVVLCRAWTSLLGWVDFTYAVHLFSAVCAAAAAASIALAARDLLASKGPLFGTTRDEGPLPDWVGTAVGALAACGYTFWSAAILAKVYALYLLILGLLLWRMIRADESGKPRDFTVVAALIGLAWQAHPSAASAGLGLVWFVAFHRRLLGARGILMRTGVAAACALGPALLLPVLAAREPALMLGRPSSPGELLEFVSGSRFAQIPGAFGIAPSRVTSVGRFFWEEFLGIGSLLVLAGLARLWTLNRRLLGGLAAWIAPVLGVTVLFKLEGQHDFWMMAAWLPLWLVAAVGMSGLGRFREGAVLVTLAGCLWAGIANRGDLDQRGYVLAESHGHLELDALDPNSVLVLSSDDALASAMYLQRVKGVRPDVVLVQSSLLGRDPDWYDRLLRRRHPFLGAPDYAGLRGRLPGGDAERTALGAFANANASIEHPLFFERAPAQELLRTDYRLLPAGALIKVVPKATSNLDPRYWTTPLEAERLPSLFRRERGQYVRRAGASIEVRPEAFERRLLRDLLRARKNRADWLALSGSPEGLKQSAELYETIVALDPWMAEDPAATVPLARVYYALGQFDRAEPWLKKSVGLPVPPRIRAQLCCLLVDLYRAWNRPDEARRWVRAALGIPELPAELRRRLETP